MIVCSVKGRKFTLSLKAKDHVLEICVLYDAFVTVLLFAPLLRCLVKPAFCRYFREFLVTTPSAEMTKGYIDTWLSFQIFFISGPKFSYFVTFYYYYYYYYYYDDVCKQTGLRMPSLE